MSFGRRGLQPGAQQGQPTPAQRARPDLSKPGPSPNADRVAAFLTEERRRAADEGQRRTRYHEADGVDSLASQASSGFSQVAHKSMGLAYVLWWFAYPFSAHRFYLGDTGGAIKQCGGFLGSLLLVVIGVGNQLSVLSALAGITFILSLLWIIADMFFIPGLCRKANARIDAQHRVFS